VACGYDHDLAGSAAAREALTPDRATALPALRLTEIGAAVDVPDWTPARDLLGVDGSAQLFVVEFERGASADRIGRPRLRFGDDRAGRRPPAGTRFAAAGRSGGGVAGNVGAEALAHVVTPLTGITRVRNPLPAVGGTPPESFPEARRSAPEAFRTQRRAVTPADYVAVAEEHPDVQRASAAVRWTGSWHSVFVTVDRLGGRRVAGDRIFRDDLTARLDARRLTGADVELRDPVDVPVDLELRVCAAPDVVAADVEREIRQGLSARVLADGSTGLFHPDRWSFGDPLYLSPVVAAVQAIDGVTAVEAITFQRLGRPAAGELADGVLAVADVEVVRLDDDPSFPERGRLAIEMRGGR
jgi:predicted phage baseplate assembly protein